MTNKRYTGGTVRGNSVLILIWGTYTLRHAQEGQLINRCMEAAKTHVITLRHLLCTWANTAQGYKTHQNLNGV